MEDVTEGLLYYAEELYRGNRSRQSYDQSKEALEKADPFLVNQALHTLISRHPDMEAVKAPVARFLRACGSALEKLPLPEYPDQSLLASLIDENRGIIALLHQMSGAFKSLMSEKDDLPHSDSIQLFQSLLAEVLEQLKKHYTRLQNELFPLLETAAPEYRCISLMWSIQDDVLAVGKELQHLLSRVERAVAPLEPDHPEESHPPKQEHRQVQLVPDQINILTGKFFLDAKSLIWREERILFPVASRYAAHTFSGSTADRGPTGANGSTAVSGPEAPGTNSSPDTVFTCPTGSLNKEELEAIFRTLPVDITFVDKAGKVKFFSDTPDRIFPRHPAILGREVKNCHPPKSVERVEQIVEDLKSGKKDSEQFWLEVKGRMVFIEYYALRTPKGKFLGVMEASRDITEVRKLQGEKRL